MMDLRDEMNRLAGPAHAPTPAEIDADLARGRSALRRRRSVQAMTGSAFAVAALVVAVAVATSGGGTGVTSPERPVITAQLVAYTGEQPKGFTIDKVPAGWFIQADDEGALVLAPETAKNPGPDVNPSTSPEFDPRSFVGKIAIMLQSKDQDAPEGEEVKAGDKDAVLVPSPDGQGFTLWIAQPDAPSVLIQFWEDFGLSQEQVLELGAGVHVHEGAVQGVG